MDFKEVRTGTFFFNPERGLLLFVKEKNNSDLIAYLLDEMTSKISIKLYTITKWNRTIWGSMNEAENFIHASRKMIRELFKLGKITNEI